MRAGGSKQKGSAFERQMCKSLSLWASSGLREDLYWRSSMSGGRSTIQVKKGKQNTTQAGDISSIDRTGSEFIERFCVECKHYKTLDLIPGIIQNRGALHGFWKRLLKDAAGVKKLPILIAKQNRLPTLVLLTEGGASQLNLRRGDCLSILLQWNCELYNIDVLLGCRYPFQQRISTPSISKEKLHVSL
jgi:hypothetical protein